MTAVAADERIVRAAINALDQGLVHDLTRPGGAAAGLRLPSQARLSRELTILESKRSPDRRAANQIDRSRAIVGSSQVRTKGSADIGAGPVNRGDTGSKHQPDLRGRRSFFLQPTTLPCTPTAVTTTTASRIGCETTDPHADQPPRYPTTTSRWWCRMRGPTRYACSGQRLLT